MKNPKIISALIFCFAVPVICLSGLFIFPDKWLSWTVISAIIVICGLSFFLFEKKNSSALELAVMSAFTALSIIGRICFAAVGGFKPCTAIIILAGVYLGREQGFMVGALTALVSNFYFGQGTWTPFQMIVWGLIGYLSGILSKKLSENRAILLVFGAICGALFSAVMDLWSCLWADNTLNLTRYLVMLASSVQFTVIYMVSNVVFLLLLMTPTKRIFTRLQQKYNISREEK